MLSSAEDVDRDRKPQKIFLTFMASLPDLTLKVSRFNKHDYIFAYVSEIFSF